MTKYTTILFKSVMMGTDVIPDLTLAGRPGLTLAKTGEEPNATIPTPANDSKTDPSLCLQMNQE